MSADDTANRRDDLPELLVPMSSPPNVAFFWKHKTREDYHRAWFLANWMPIGYVH